MRWSRPYFRVQYQLTLSVFIFTAMCLATFAVALYVLSDRTLIKMQKDNLDLNCEIRSNLVAANIEDRFTISNMLSLSHSIRTILANSQNLDFVTHEGYALSRTFKLNEVIFLDLFDKNISTDLSLQSKSLSKSANLDKLRPLYGLNQEEISRVQELHQNFTRIDGPYLIKDALAPGNQNINELMSFTLAITQEKGFQSLNQQKTQDAIFGYMTVVFSVADIVNVLQDRFSNAYDSHVDSAILCKKQNDSTKLKGVLPAIDVTIGPEQTEKISDPNPHFNAEVVDVPGEGKLLVSVTRVSSATDYFVLLNQHPEGYNAMTISLRNVILISVFSIVAGMLIFTLIGASFGSRQILRLKMATTYETPNSRRWLIIPWWLQPKASHRVSDINSEYRIPDDVPLRPHLRDELDAISQRFNMMSNSLASQYSTLVECVDKRKADIKQALEAANEANEAKTHFLARITHELRSPLNGIVGTATLCLDDDNVDQIHQSLKTIFKCGELLLYLITDLLSFNENEEENFKLDMRDFTISDIKNQLTAIFTEQCDMKNIQLIFEIQPGTGSIVIHGDTNRILQIIFNLISNALKFTPRGGKVYFRLKIQPSNSNIHLFTFEVEDTGPGIAPHLQHNIFDEFFQADVDERAHKAGVGLGLYISRNLAVRMGGNIGLKSQLGKGSLFSLHIPLAVSPFRKSFIENQEVDNYPDSPLYSPSHLLESNKIDFSINKHDTSLSSERPTFSRSQSSFEHLPSDLNVLVTDDNKVNQEVMRRMLELEGIQNIEVASDGIDALNKVQDSFCGSPFDIVFMDVQMPNMDGYEASKRIRSQLHYKGKIIAVSAFANDENANRCILAGMDMFLSKPLRRPHLRQILRDAENSNEKLTP